MSEIIIIAAVSKNGVIGKDGNIPWKIKEDFQHFKKLTLGYPVIMGRKTWDSLPKKPLKDRLNIVLTRQEDFKPEGAVVKKSLEEAVDYCQNYGKIFIAGGQSAYEKALPIADRLELTKIQRDYEGDSYFPIVNWEDWVLEKEENMEEAFSVLLRTVVERLKMEKV